MAKKTKYFHCDGYYYEWVCPSRGGIDVADIRYDQDGWIRRRRCFCMTRGLTPLQDLELCQHCTEHRHLFRSEPEHHVSRVVDITAYKAITATYKVAKAYMTRKSLVRFMKDKPELHGVNCQTGKIISAPKEIPPMTQEAVDYALEHNVGKEK